MKKIYYLLFLFVLFLIPLSSQAYVIKSDDFIYIAKDEVVEGNFYFAGQSLTVEGLIQGDLIGIAQNIQINGIIEGDLITACQNLTINGEIKGNLRTLNNITYINGTVEKNVNFLGENLILNQDSSIGKDLWLQAMNLELYGKINNNLHGGSMSALINGEVGKNINLVLDNKKSKKYYSSLKIGENAIILGNLNYTSGNEANILSKNISGETKQKFPESKKGKNKSSKLFYSIISSFIIALIINRLFKKQLKETKELLIKKNYKLLLPGTIIFILAPISVLIIFITIIGIPLALILLALWFLILYLSKIIVAMLLGDYIFILLKKENINETLKILSGIIVAFLIFALPYIGWLFSLASMIAIFGAIYYIIKNKKHVN